MMLPANQNNDTHPHVSTAESESWVMLENGKAQASRPHQHLAGDSSPAQTSGACTGFRSAAGRVLQPTRQALNAAQVFFDEDLGTLGDTFDEDEGEKAWQAPAPDDVTPSGEHAVGDDDLSSRTWLSPASRQHQGELSPWTATVDADKFATVSQVCCGFKTASGKDFSLPSKYQKKAEDMWNSVLKEMQSDRSVDSRTDPHPQTSHLALDESLTAQLDITKTARCTDKTEPTVSGQTSCNSQKFPEETHAVTGSAGFKTAGGKMLCLSAKSQQKAAELWKSVERELKSEGGHQEDEMNTLKPGRSLSPLGKSPGRCGSGNGSGETTPRELRVGKPSISPSHPAMTSRNVPQGFRPFKVPTVIRTVTEEDRYTTKIPEYPTVPQKNTLLHHFSQVQVTRGTSEDSRGSKRKLSDEFSDDDDVWNIENMEALLNSGVCQQREHEGAEPSSSECAHADVTQNRPSSKHAHADVSRNVPSSKHGHSAVTENIPSSKHAHADVSQNVSSSKYTHADVTQNVCSLKHAYTDATQNASTSVHSEASVETDSQGKRSVGQPPSDQSSSVVNLNNKTVAVRCVEITDVHEHGGNSDDANLDDMEMSDAVITELSHDMYEVAQSTSHTSCNTPVMQFTSVPPSSVRPEELVTEGQKVSVKLPPKDSPLPLAMGNVSFESLRCDESVSFDEKELSFSLTESGEAKSRGGSEHEQSLAQTDGLDLGEIQADVVGLKATDFDSSFPDPETEPGIGQVGAGEVDSDGSGDGRGGDDDDDDDIASSFVEKDFIDLGGLEQDLNTSQAEVSGGVVWTDDTPDDWPADSSEDQRYGSALTTPVHSSDAVLEEKHGHIFTQTGGSVDEVGHDMEDIDDVFAGDFENDPVTTGAGSIVPAHATRLKAELGNHDDERQGEKVAVGSVSAEIQSCSSDRRLEKENSKVLTSPEELLGDVSWSDITCTLNPSQWGEGKEMCAQGDVTEGTGREGCTPHIDTHGDSDTHTPFTAYCSDSDKHSPSAAYSSTSKPPTVPESEISKSVTYMSETSGVICSVREGGTGDESVNGSQVHLCPDSEGFQITSDLSQLFSSPMSQPVIEHPSVAGDSFSGDSHSSPGSNPPISDKDSMARVGFGFQTAAGSAVGVSATSLEKVKHLFAGEIESPEDSNSLVPLVFPLSSSPHLQAAAGLLEIIESLPVSSPNKGISQASRLQGEPV
ncbi:uncharacterized protein LOC143275743 [Babylonia areolata]|uniref:uncharacterized protein LOC143275743 n=1 Tax=Babylonia areolata TaxID=304850 RepID=UPI003FD0AD2E